MTDPENRTDLVEWGSTGRAPVISLPADADEAAALVLQYVTTGETSVDRASAINSMNSRLNSLKELNGQAQENELLSHAAVLHALFLRYSAHSVACKVVDHSLRYGKIAMQAHESYTRTLVAVEGLRQQRQGRHLPAVE